MKTAMQHVRSRIAPFIGTKGFYKGALAVMLPVTIQQLINNMFNMADNLLVGSLDMQGLAMTAVSVANKPVMIFNGFTFGLAGAGGLLISQYFGARNRKACQGIFWMEMMLSILNAAMFFALLFFLPETIMRIFVTDPRTIDLGVQYMKIISFSYFPAAISGACIFSLRSLGQNKTPMMVSLVSMVVDTALSFVLIFGKLGFPALGVQGAAYATLIARIFEMSMYLALMLRKQMYFTFEPKACLHLDKAIRKKFMAKALPLIINELFYGFGLNIFFWSYARLDEAALPALAIAELCYQISSVIIAGCSSAVSVLIGTALGAGELDKARDHTKKLLSLTVMIGLASVVICCGLAFVLPLLYKISNELRSVATLISCIMAVFAPFGFVYGFCFFCLRAGGDTRNAMLLDSGYMWLVPVPICLAIGFLLPGKMAMAVAVLIVQVAMNAKLIPALLAVKKGTWVRNITVDC